MIKVLMYLFENYMENSISFKVDVETLFAELEKAGFAQEEIVLALDWLEDLNQFQKFVLAGPPLTQHAMRHYCPEELDRLGVDGVGFILYLEQLGILDPTTREIVIDRLMALNYRHIDFGRIKWVVLLVLFNQPEKKAALSLLQDLVLSEARDTLH